MDTKIKGAGWWNTGIALLALLAGMVTLWASRTGTMPAPMTCFVLAFLLIGFLVAFVSSLHLQLLDREKQEQLEYEETATGSADSSMFESDAFAARRSREHFDRWIIPIFTVFLLLLEIGVTCWVIWGNTRYNDFQQAQVLEGSYVLVAVSSLFGMFLFLRGRYATLLSVKLKAVILQPGSDFLLLGAYLFFLQAAVSAAALLEYPLAHQYLAVGLCIFMGVLAVETLLRLILEIYRPRMKGQEIRQLYHSRLVGLISKPEGFFTTAAHALDYQFGFKVSETWGYRFLRERLALIVLLQVFVLWLSSAIVIIPQGQVGYLERNGVPVETREPGISFKWPWPIDSVQRHFQGAVRMLYIGPEMDPRRHAGRSFYWFDDEGGELHMPGEARGGPQVNSLWSEPNVRDYDKHLEREKLYKTYFAARIDSANKGEDKKALLFGGVFVQFRVSEVEKYANYAAEPIEVLEKLVTRQITRHFGQADVESILTTGRGRLASGVLGAVQKEVDDIGLGLEVLSIGLQGVQPPAEMAMLAATSQMDTDKTREAGAGSPVQKYEEYFSSRIMNHGSRLLNSVGTNTGLSLALIKQTNKVALGQLEAADILRKALEQSDREDEFFKLYKNSPRVFPAFQLIDAQTNYLGSIDSKIVLIGVDAEGYEVDLKQGAGGLLDAGGRVSVDPSQ